MQEGHFEKLFLVHDVKPFKSELIARMILVCKCRKVKGPQDEIVTSLALPPVSFARATLQVESHYPRSAVAGQAFTADFTVSNLTPNLQQLSLAVGDASGFVIVGNASYQPIEIKA